MYCSWCRSCFPFLDCYNTLVPKSTLKQMLFRLDHRRTHRVPLWEKCRLCRACVFLMDHRSELVSEDCIPWRKISIIISFTSSWEWESLLILGKGWFIMMGWKGSDRSFIATASLTLQKSTHKTGKAVVWYFTSAESRIESVGMNHSCTRGNETPRRPRCRRQIYFQLPTSNARCVPACHSSTWRLSVSSRSW